MQSNDCEQYACKANHASFLCLANYRRAYPHEHYAAGCYACGQNLLHTETGAHRAVHSLAECVCLRFEWGEGIRQDKQSFDANCEMHPLSGCTFSCISFVFFIPLQKLCTLNIWRSKIAYNGRISTKGICRRQIS